MKHFLLFAATILVFVGCDNKFEDEGNSLQMISDLPIFTVGFEEDTRTYVEDGAYLRWHEGDNISVFLGNTKNHEYVFEGKTGDNSGSFSARYSVDLGSGYYFNKYFALYPHRYNTGISTDGVISYTFPSIQEYANESFGKAANTMIAVTKDRYDNFLSFKNICGYLKIKLYGNAMIKSITLKGNNGEKIAGNATITATYDGTPTATMTNNTTESITLDCGNGVQLSVDAENPTEFWFVIPPTEFIDGVTIVATDVYGGIFEKSTSNTVAITRNNVKSMSAIDTVFPKPECPNNEIWYISTDGKFIEPHAPNVFGANIISNIYENGIGIIRFDSDITTIGDHAFFSCDSLASVTIPDSVTTIGDHAFFSCDSLASVTIPDSVTTIGEYAFAHCDSLTSVTIPDSVTTIGGAAFAGCTSLKEFKGKFAADNGRCLIKDNTIIAYAEASGTEYTIPDSVTTIGENVFYDCDSLTSVTIGDSVTTIGEYAFGYCNSLTSVTIGDSVTTIRGHAFSYCNSLTSITIPDSVTTIGDWAFSSCNSLTSITIPDSVTTIGAGAFYDCDSLTSVTFGDSVKTISNSAFDGCNNLTEFSGKYASEDGRCLIIDGTLHLFAPAGLTEYTIPDSVTTIGERAFGNCDSLTSVTIPDSVTTIGDSAFNGCSSLTSVTIGDSVTTIGDSAFYSCGSLTSVTIPDSVTTIGEWAFGNCKSLTRITIPDSVTTIRDEAFRNCESLTSVTIGDSVTTIGDFAFYDCDSLTSITIPDSVTTIGEYAFSSCDSLTSVTFGDSVKTISNSAFDGCNNLTEFSGKYASEDGRCLIIDGTLHLFAPAGRTEYTIPDSVTTIGERAFHNCYSLTSITIPDSVTTIGNYAFYDCGSLTSITIPDSVTTIGNSAFEFCGSLKSVTIGDSVTMIGNSAFLHCRSIKSIYCKPTTPPSLGYYAFQYWYYFDENYYNIDCKIYVPRGSGNTYKTALSWIDYAYQINEYDF